MYMHAVSGRLASRHHGLQDCAMIDWELAIATAVAFGVLVFILRCLWVLLFTRAEGEKVEPTEISVVDLIPFQNHDSDR